MSSVHYPFPNDSLFRIGPIHTKKDCFEMPSYCSGIVSHFDVLVVGASVAGISAMLSAVSYGGQVALADEKGVHEHLREYFGAMEPNSLNSFDLCPIRKSPKT